MKKKGGLGKLFVNLEGALQEVEKGLQQVGEKLENEVVPGVEKAVVWAEFIRIVSPILEKSSGETLSLKAIDAMLLDEKNQTPEVVQAREERSAFIAKHGIAAWNACVQYSGKLRIQVSGGNTTIIDINPSRP